MHVTGSVEVDWDVHQYRLACSIMSVTEYNYTVQYTCILLLYRLYFI